MAGMDDNPARKPHGALASVCLLLLLLGAYAISYGLLVQPIGVVTENPPGFVDYVDDDYRFTAGLMRYLFWSANQFDRRVRPDVWTRASYDP
jgi:hypothetical protein